VGPTLMALHPSRVLTVNESRSNQLAVVEQVDSVRLDVGALPEVPGRATKPSERDTGRTGKLLTTRRCRRKELARLEQLRPIHLPCVIKSAETMKAMLAEGVGRGGITTP